jgi:arylsulfatase A-like enzyme
MIDLLPTLLEFAGCPVPECLMGRSYAAALRRNEPLATRDDVIAYAHHESAMLRTTRYKYVRYNQHGTEVLFDLAEEPPELVNHAEDPAYLYAIQDMRERMLHRCLAACRSPRRETFLW